MARTSACDTLPNALDVRPLCLFGIRGHNGCCNDALFKPALPRRTTDLNPIQKTLVFFGGDIQNFIHLMDQNDPTIQYQRWCLEAAAARLGADFPDHHIIIIKPSRVVFDHVSCFDNFVQGNFVGVPKHIFHYSALPHLEKLLKTISKKIRQMPSEELFKMLLTRQDEEDFMDDDDPSDLVWQYELMTNRKKESLFKWQKSLRLHTYPQTLLAFGKGCVVLNQFLYEFHYVKRLEPFGQYSRFINRIAAMYWLDGGHPGHDNVYLTSRAVIKTVIDLGIEVHCHVSQYQTEDYNRPWIRKQWQEFAGTLKEYKAKLIVHRHLTNTTELRSHFNVFLSFMEVEISSYAVPSNAPLLEPPARVSSPSESPAPSETSRNERALMHREILGVALVSPHSTPYLALQLILRRPLNEIMLSYATNNSNAPPQMPSASVEAPSTSAAQTPSTSAAQNRSDSDQNPSTSSAQNHDSASARSSSTSPPSANDFTVLIRRESTKINFNEDTEAAEAFLAANYYKMDSPVIAISTDMPLSPSLNVYSPVNNVYSPTVLNPMRLNTIRRYDSSAATTPRLSGAVASNAGATLPPAENIPRNNIGTVPPAPNNASRSVRSNNAQAAPRVSQSNNAQAAPGAAQSNNAQAAPGAAQTNNAQAAPGAAQSNNAQAASGAAQSTNAQAAPKAAQSNNAQAAPRAAQSNNAQAAPRAAQSSNAQAAPGAAQSNNAQAASGTDQSNNAQAAPRAAQSNNAQAAPRAAQSNNAQAAPRAAQSSNAQAAPRAAQSNNTAQLPRAGQSNTSHAAPGAVQGTSTSQANPSTVHADQMPSVSPATSSRRNLRSQQHHDDSPYAVNGRNATNRYNLRSMR